MEIELCGDLGGLLRLASGVGDCNAGAGCEGADIVVELFLVAGARFGHCFARCKPTAQVRRRCNHWRRFGPHAHCKR